MIQIHLSYQRLSFIGNVIPSGNQKGSLFHFHTSVGSSKFPQVITVDLNPFSYVHNICALIQFGNYRSTEFSMMYVQFVMTYTLFKTQVAEAPVSCNFLFSNHLNSVLLSLVNLILY